MRIHFYCRECNISYCCGSILELDLYIYIRFLSIDNVLLLFVVNHHKLQEPDGFVL